MTFVSVTRLRVRSWRFIPGFLLHSGRSSRQAITSDGVLAVSLLWDTRNTFWTRTLWRDEAAMRTFMLSGDHATAMPRLLQWCDEASVVNWVQDEAYPPPWIEAHARMQRDGRPSKLLFPNASHAARHIRAPTSRRFRQIGSWGGSPG